MPFILMICRQFYWKRDKKWFCSVWRVDCEWYLLHETKVILCCMVCWLWVVPSARDKKWFCSVWCADCEWYLLHETKSDFVLYAVLTVSGTFCTRQKVILFCMVCWLWVVPSARDKSDFVLYGVLTVSGTFCTRQKVILFCMVCWLWVVPSARDKKWFCSVWCADCEWYLLHETKSDFVLYGVLTVSGTFCTRQKWFCSVWCADCEWYLLHETKSDFVLYGVLTVSGTFCTRQKWFCAVWCVDCEWYLLHETKSDFVLYGVLTVSGTFCTRQKVILFCMVCWLWVVPSARDKKWFCAVWRVDCEWYLLHETKSDFVLYAVLTVSGTFCTRQKVILFCMACWLWVVPSARDKKWFCAVWCVDCEWYLLHETKVILCCMVCWLWVVPSARDKSDFVLYGVLTVSGTFCMPCRACCRKLSCCWRVASSSLRWGCALPCSCFKSSTSFL